MKFHYYPETDSLYIELKDLPSIESEEIQEGIILDFDENRQLVGIDIEHASRSVNLTKLEIDSLPVKQMSVV